MLVVEELFLIAFKELSKLYLAKVLIFLYLWFKNLLSLIAKQDQEIFLLSLGQKVFFVCFSLQYSLPTNSFFDRSAKCKHHTSYFISSKAFNVAKYLFKCRWRLWWKNPPFNYKRSFKSCCCEYNLHLVLSKLIKFPSFG